MNWHKRRSRWRTSENSAASSKPTPSRRRRTSRAAVEGEQRQQRVAQVLEGLLREEARRVALDARRQVAEQSYHLGRISTQRTGPHSVSEVWEDGQALREVQQKQAALLAQRDALEREKKAATKAARRGGGSSGGDASEDLGAIDTESPSRCG